MRLQLLLVALVLLSFVAAAPVRCVVNFTHNGPRFAYGDVGYKGAMAERKVASRHNMTLCLFLDIVMLCLIAITQRRIDLETNTILCLFLDIAILCFIAAALVRVILAQDRAFSNQEIVPRYKDLLGFCTNVIQHPAAMVTAN
ncbi:MAG: hypothetical protein JOS17DRAFT_778087 [Linnemannia elongata]|nr:MAG: hypothetical protein JOS17DRAFT_778087 [Linnemannia elongata]